MQSGYYLKGYVQKNCVKSTHTLHYQLHDEVPQLDGNNQKRNNPLVFLCYTQGYSERQVPL